MFKYSKVCGDISSDLSLGCVVSRIKPKQASVITGNDLLQPQKEQGLANTTIKLGLFTMGFICCKL